MNQINLMTWFGDRQVEFCPQHFIKCNAPLSTEATLWIYEMLRGRFYIGSDNFIFDQDVYFEDPAEATLYELTWS